MSLVDIGSRPLPNLYVDFVHMEQRTMSGVGHIPKMKVFFILKDAIINGKPFWSKKHRVLNRTNIVYTLEDIKGRVYHTQREPLGMVLNNPSIQTDSRGNTVYLYRIERTIDTRSFYHKDKSLIIKTYVEKTYGDRSTKSSSIMREVIQSSNGTVPKKSFYFTFNNGEIYSGPFHYHAKSKRFMVGEKHSSKSHPLININYTQNKSVDAVSIEKTLRYVNNKKKTYNFNSKAIASNYVTTNCDRSVSNLFVIDLYKILLTADHVSQKLFELNKSLFNELSREINIFEMGIGRIRVGRRIYKNILYTPVVKSSEIGSEKRLMTLHNLKEGRTKNSQSSADTYYDDGVLYVLLTDNQIKQEEDGKYKYVANLKLRPTISKYIDKKIKKIQNVIAYYEMFLRSLENPAVYDKSRHKLNSSYIRSIFEKHTDFEVDDKDYIIMNQDPEFHKHIDAFMEGVALVKFIEIEERENLHRSLNQLISPLETDKKRINNFIKLCVDLIYQIRHRYKISRYSNDKSSMKKSAPLLYDIKDSKEFTYAKKRKAYNIFKGLNRPIVTVNSMKKRFNLERSRYFQKGKGDTSFNTLPSNIRSAFVSDKESRYGYLSPIGLQMPSKVIDLENFDMFDDIVNEVYDNPNIKLEKRIPSTLTLMRKNISYLDSANILGEQSDFIINKVERRNNFISEINPVVLNYTFSTNSLVDVDRDKFDLNKQENALLAFTKIIPEKERISTVRELPFQTKSLFYPDNMKNPLNRIKQSSNFKVKRLLKSIAFTTYKMEYLHGYRRFQGRADNFRNIHSPIWKNMDDPSKLRSNSKYFLLKLSTYDKFGFRNTGEFNSNQNFVLMKNNKYSSTSTQQTKPKFIKKYSIDDFSLQSFHTLNLLNNSIEETTALSKDDKYTTDWDPKKFSMLNSVTNSATTSNRTRKSVKSRTRKKTSSRTRSSAPKRTRGGY